MTVSRSQVDEPAARLMSKLPSINTQLWRPLSASFILVCSYIKKETTVGNIQAIFFTTQNEKSVVLGSIIDIIQQSAAQALGKVFFFKNCNSYSSHKA